MTINETSTFSFPGRHLSGMLLLRKMLEVGGNSGHVLCLGPGPFEMHTMAGILGSHAEGIVGIEADKEILALTHDLIFQTWINPERLRPHCCSRAYVCTSENLDLSDAGLMYHTKRMERLMSTNMLWYFCQTQQTLKITREYEGETRALEEYILADLHNIKLGEIPEKIATTNIIFAGDFFSCLQEQLQDPSALSTWFANFADLCKVPVVLSVSPSEVFSENGPVALMQQHGFTPVVGFCDRTFEMNGTQHGDYIVVMLPEGNRVQQLLFSPVLNLLTRIFEANFPCTTAHEYQKIQLDDRKDDDSWIPITWKYYDQNRFTVFSLPASALCTYPRHFISHGEYKYTHYWDGMVGYFARVML